VYIVANFALLVTFNVAILLSDRVNISREQDWIADPLYLDLILIAANSLGPLIVLKWELFRQAQERVDKAQRQELLQNQAHALAEQTMSDEFFKFVNPVSAIPMLDALPHTCVSQSTTISCRATVAAERDSTCMCVCVRAQLEQ
jgi:hypothetical protein